MLSGTADRHRVAKPRIPVTGQGGSQGVHVLLCQHRGGKERASVRQHLLPQPRRHMEIPLGVKPRGKTRRLLQDGLRREFVGRHHRARMLERTGTEGRRHHEIRSAHIRQPARHLLSRGEAGRLEGGCHETAQGQAMDDIPVPQRGRLVQAHLHHTQGLEGQARVRQLRRSGQFLLPVGQRTVRGVQQEQPQHSLLRHHAIRQQEGRQHPCRGSIPQQRRLVP